MRWRIDVIAFPVMVFWAGAAIADEIAQIETSLGRITVALDRAHAPKTVANFVSYAREGHFDGTMIYRVEPGFVIQMGSYEASGVSRPVHAPIPLESGNGLTNTRGSLAMARTEDAASATAEFFIDLANNANLDPAPGVTPNTSGYAVFGKVISGMDVVDKIAAMPRGGKGPFPPESTPARPIEIQKVTISDTGLATGH